MKGGAQQVVRVENLSRLLEELTVSHERTGRLIVELKNQIRYLNSNQGRVIERVVSLEQCKQLVGSRVRILNPAKQEPNTGVISAVGKLYVTITLPGGIKRNRISKNLRLIEDE